MSIRPAVLQAERTFSAAAILCRKIRSSLSGTMPNLLRFSDFHRQQRAPNDVVYCAANAMAEKTNIDVKFHEVNNKFQWNSYSFVSNFFVWEV
jgi:hypothetical protein